MSTPRPTILLLLLLFTATSILTNATTAVTFPTHDPTTSISSYTIDDFTCSDNNCFDNENEAEEADRRQLLTRRRRFLSYAMLKRNQVPCNRRGVSYYNCYHHGRANPYRRGCSYITRCARDLR